VLLAGLPWSAAAQEEAVSPAAAALSPAGQELVRATLSERIAAAGYFELLDELRVLGLDDRGSRAELAARLRRFYGLPAPSSASGELFEVVQIRQAGRAEYYTAPETGADSVILRGAVEVLVRKTDPNTVHVIRADEVIHDRTGRLLTARGGVAYEVTQEGEDAQEVHAASMSFDLDSSKAVFLDATTRQRRRGASGPLTFTFTAGVITRLTDGTIILDDVRFSSSPEPALPNYEVRAQRMWLLAPGEWAMQSATLRVGRVPLMYLPYFVWPGDELVFHPALGVRDREGLFLNTTLYLIGRRPRDDEPFSVLSLTDPGEYREELRGMFLRKIRGEDPRSEEHYLKLMLDLYTRLGVHSGFAGRLPVADGGEVSFQFGAARSRSIFFVPAQGGYTAVDANGLSHWHDSTLFGVTFPLRYGFDFAGNARTRGASVRAGMEVYSDPEFVRDFGNREERIDWPGLLGFEGGADSSPGRRSSLTWELLANADLNDLLAGGARPPLLERVRISNAGVRWLWHNRSDPSVPSHDPTRSFFYPSSLRLPASAEISGTLWQLPSASSASTRAEPPEASAGRAVAGRGLRLAAAPPAEDAAAPPAEDAAEAEPDTGEQAAADTGDRLPELRRDAYRAPPPPPVPAVTPPAKARVGYQLSPGVIVEANYGSDTWRSASDVDFALESIVVRGDHTSRVSQSLDLYGGLFSFDHGLRHNLTVLQPHRRSALVNDDAWERLVEQSRQRSRASLQLTNRFTWRPVRHVAGWQDSNLTYDIDMRLVNVVYDSQAKVYRTRTGAWDADGISRHRLQTAAAWQLGDHPQRLTLAGDLPPRPLLLSAQLDLSAGVVSGGAVLRARCEDSERTLGECAKMIPDPLSVNLRVSPFEPLSLSERVAIDLVRSQFERSETTLSFSGLSASLIAVRPEPGEALEARQLRLGYAESFGPHYEWRNRISVGFSPATSWTIDFIEPRRSRFSLTTSLTVAVHEFLDLSFRTASSNDRTYCYFAAWADDSCTTRDPVEDLWWSLSLWDESKRRQSNFKVDRISLSAVHHLQDWDLTVEYAARPVAREGGFREFASQFSIFVQWIPVPEIRGRVGGDDDTIFLGESDSQS
jgi:hypothetical protein